MRVAFAERLECGAFTAAIGPVKPSFQPLIWRTFEPDNPPIFPLHFLQIFAAINLGMHWNITCLEIGELGLFVFALWIPFRMGRAGIRNLWCVLAGWFALAGLMLTLVSLSMLGTNGVDSELVNSMPEGPHALIALLFGWLPAWGAANAGRK